MLIFTILITPLVLYFYVDQYIKLQEYIASIEKNKEIVSDE